MTPAEKKEKEIVQIENNGADVKDTKTIELVTILTFFSVTLTSEASRTIGMEKECYRNEYYNNWSPRPWNLICYDIRHQIPVHPSYVTYVLENYSAHLIWRTAVQSIMACLVLIFLGGWSDRTGKRKAILLLPIIGVSLQIIHSAINIIFLYQLPVEYFVFFDALFGSLVSGGIIFFGLFTYVFEFSSVEDRLYRLGGIVISALTGMTSGYILSWILLRFIGYTSVYVFASITNVINHWHISKKLEEPLRTMEQMQYDGQTCKGSLKTFFDCSSIKDTIAVVKVTSDNRNVKLYTYFGTMFILFVSVFGEQSIYSLMFTVGLYWNRYMLNIFNIVKCITAILGVWLTVTLFSKRFKLHDAVIGIISSISKIISSLFYCFAFDAVAIYFGVAFDIFNGTALLAIVSMYSKLLERNEIGKVNSLVGIIENLSRLVYVSIYWIVYMETYNSDTAIYLTGLGFTVPAIFVFLWILHRKKIEEVKQEMLMNNPANI